MMLLRRTLILQQLFQHEHSDISLLNVANVANTFTENIRTLLIGYCRKKYLSGYHRKSFPILAPFKK